MSSLFVARKINTLTGTIVVRGVQCSKVVERNSLSNANTRDTAHLLARYDKFARTVVTHMIPSRNILLTAIFLVSVNCSLQTIGIGIARTAASSSTFVIA